MAMASDTMQAQTDRLKEESDRFYESLRYGDRGQYMMEVPADWRSTFDQLRKAGLSEAQIDDAVGIAMRSKVPLSRCWAYFCGVCWTKVRKQREIATALLDAEMENES
jgi:hypothetical protein